jgi:transporter family protein
MDLLLGVSFGIFAMLAYGFAEIAEVQASRKTLILRSNLWGWFIGSVLFVSIYFFVFHAKLPSITAAQMILSAVAGILSAIGYLTFYKALRSGKASVVDPVANGGAIIAVVLGLVILGERLLLTQAFGIVLIVGGTLLISIERKSANRRAKNYAVGLNYAVLTMVFWGLTLFIIGFLVQKIGWFAPVLFSAIAATVTDFILALVSRTKLTFPINAAKPILIESIVSAVGFMFYSFGVSVSSIAIVAPIAGASTFVTVITALVLFKERPNIFYTLSIASLIVGLVLLSA